MTRREFAVTAGAASVAAVGFGARAKGAETKTLRFIAQSDLRVLDPIWTTAYITRNHGYMVFDTLFALDSKFKPHPQMVGDFSISPDKLVYSFTLRDGLKFHDGQPVRGVDCTTSLKRWMARDALGETLAAAIDEMKGGDDKNFTIRLKEPFPLLIDAIAKVSSLAPFIMPERLAKTDPYEQVTEMVGSGPFKFVKSEFEPGHRVVYIKNTDYAPRNEPSDCRTTAIGALPSCAVRYEPGSWQSQESPTSAGRPRNRIAISRSKRAGSVYADAGLRMLASAWSGSAPSLKRAKRRRSAVCRLGCTRDGPYHGPRGWTPAGRRRTAPP